jgi:hypothetical protein
LDRKSGEQRVCQIYPPKLLLELSSGNTLLLSYRFRGGLVWLKKALNHTKKRETLVLGTALNGIVVLGTVMNILIIRGRYDILLEMRPNGVAEQEYTGIFGKSPGIIGPSIMECLRVWRVQMEKKRVNFKTGG